MIPLVFDQFIGIGSGSIRLLSIVSIESPLNRSKWLRERNIRNDRHKQRKKKRGVFFVIHIHCWTILANDVILLKQNTDLAHTYNSVFHADTLIILPSHFLNFIFFPFDVCLMYIYVFRGYV